MGIRSIIAAAAVSVVAFSGAALAATQTFTFTGGGNTLYGPMDPPLTATGSGLTVSFSALSNVPTVSPVNTLIFRDDGLGVHKGSAQNQIGRFEVVGVNITADPSVLSYNLVSVSFFKLTPTINDDIVEVVSPGGTENVDVIGASGSVVTVPISVGTDATSVALRNTLNHGLSDNYGLLLQSLTFELEREEVDVIPLPPSALGLGGALLFGGMFLRRRKSKQAA